jgi:hypothetical protein
MEYSQIVSNRTSNNNFAVDGECLSIEAKEISHVLSTLSSYSQIAFGGFLSNKTCFCALYC